VENGWATKDLLRMAGVAAIVASLCDLMMLSVVLVPSADLWAAPDLMLGASAVLGALSIPVYAIGYGAIARSLDSAYSGLRRTITVSGMIVGVVGGVIHVMTAILICQKQSSEGVWAVEDALNSGPLLPILWAIAMLASLVATGAIVFAKFSGRGTLPAIVAALNPAVVTVFVIAGVLVGGSEGLAAFVVPAAPNLAHVVFFIVGAMCAESIGHEEPE
jgi:hypothetical protein